MDVSIPPLDDDAMTATHAAIAPGRHGRLEGLAVWLAGVQGSVPPRAPARRRVVVFGDSTVAGDVKGEGTYDDGAALADGEVDAGADVFVVVARPTVGAVAIVAALSGAEPVEVVAPGVHWAREVREVRDALLRHKAAEPLELATHIGDAAMVGFLVQAAHRRTPVVLDGRSPAAAALVAVRCAPLAVSYFAAGHVTPDPAHRKALETLGLQPLLDLGIRDDGGGLLALPLLDAAAAIVAD